MVLFLVLFFPLAPPPPEKFFPDALDCVRITTAWYIPTENKHRLLVIQTTLLRKCGI